MYRDGVDITQSPELRRAFGRFAVCNILLISLSNEHLNYKVIGSSECCTVYIHLTYQHNVYHLYNTTTSKEISLQTCETKIIHA